ncbi:MAG TPA: hypothetical protein VJ508_01805, partial [Saprospiraceae bacterium]|nr:hypothetical protein [Saprospiraceae bacterium]
ADMIFTQQDDHPEAFRQMGFNRLRVAGDTRIDRVINLPHEADPLIPDSLKKSGTFDLIAGSTWPEDERILIPVILQMGLRTIIAPHDVRKENIDRLVKSIGQPVTRLTELTEAPLTTKILVVDSIGLLAYLYALGKIAYIGGGFGKGIHNILEPMAHHKPVLFGPKYQKFPEAIGIMQNGGGWCVKNEIELKQHLSELLLVPDNVAGRNAGRYIEQHRGATSVIATYIKESIPFG